MSKTLFDKIWDRHTVAPIMQDGALIAIDRIFLHERTGAVALNSLAAAGRQPSDPSRVFCVMDHIVDTRPGRSDKTLMPGGQAFISETREAAKRAGIHLFDVTDPDQGITHVISPELGIVLPGCTLIAPDSHTCTQGAFGALAWGVGSSDAEHAMATGTLRLKRPKTMRVEFTGTPSQGVTAKDLILALIAEHSASGGAGCVIEFCGSTVRSLCMEARMTLCNMATEFGAMTAIIAPDGKTFEYLENRRFAPKGKLWDAALADWQDLHCDENAQFDCEIVIDAAKLAPMISWGTSVDATIPITGCVPSNADKAVLEYIALERGQQLIGTSIDAAFIGSCTNARLSDLRRAAKILKDRTVSAGITAICVPGSSEVKRSAEREGLDQIFLDAGFEWRESGCSMCFFAGGESFAEDARVISSTNRNFQSRQGVSVKTHIASPETVAASAVRGAIADHRELN
ncbi:MAG: 3-isopropylmalate dehydratase large subunit [Erythrobacter sp.]|uniref:3-isopropylmalate dehydratase large subunit n=1 Tax=Erythrobacter sp. TaxID=1042 RepID=UPI00329837BB